jgi:hypothetical protein
MKIKKIQLFEIIDSNGELIGKNDVPTNDANADTQANNTTDYNSKIAQQPFRYDMLGRFGFTLLPFFEGKEDEGQKELLKDLAQLMHDKRVDVLQYYYKNPQLLKPDYRKHAAGEAHSEQCEKEDIAWAKKVVKAVEPHFEKAFKEPIDEAGSINEGLESNKQLTFKSSKNDLFYITFKFDDKDRLAGVDNKWDVSFPDWWGLAVPENEIINFFRNKYPEFYVDSPDSVNEDNVLEDKLVDKSEDEMSKKTEDNDIKEKKLEKIAGLISKLDQKDKDKLANLLERK